MERNAFVFDINRCVGCQACVVGCNIENGTHPPMYWRKVNACNHLRHPDLPVFHFSLACNHCEDAPCMKNCPAKAYTRDPETGAVIHHAEACIGCKYCTWACPYDAPRFNSLLGIVEKCNFCADRLKEGGKPACVQACPVGALDFGQRQLSESDQLVPGFVNRGIRPSIQLVPLREANLQPEILGDGEVVEMKCEELIEKPESKILLRKEWSLVLFTFFAAILVGWLGAGITGNIPVYPVSFLIAGGVAMLLSALHLGKKARAWRSILNVKDSWLSREILGFSLFMGLSGVFLLFFHESIWLGMAASVVGVLSLLAIDKVYHVAQKQADHPLHSAQVLITGLLVGAWLSGSDFLIRFTLTLKMGLYLYRKLLLWRAGEKALWGAVMFRLVLGSILPYAVWLSGMDLLWWPVLLALGLAELVDRAEYYHELEIPSPQLELYRFMRGNRSQEK